MNSEKPNIINQIGNFSDNILKFASLFIPLFLACCFLYTAGFVESLSIPETPNIFESAQFVILSFGHKFSSNWHTAVMFMIIPSIVRGIFLYTGIHKKIAKFYFKNNQGDLSNLEKEIAIKKSQILSPKELADIDDMEQQQVNADGLFINLFLIILGPVLFMFFYAAEFIFIFSPLFLFQQYALPITQIDTPVLQTDLTPILIKRYFHNRVCQAMR